jgi:hypothetical protein
VVSFTPRLLYLRYPLDRRLGEPQSRSGQRGEEKVLHPTGTGTPNPRSPSPYADYAMPAPLRSPCRTVKYEGETTFPQQHLSRVPEVRGNIHRTVPCCTKFIPWELETLIYPSFSTCRMLPWVLSVFFLNKGVANLQTDITIVIRQTRKLTGERGKFVPVLN